MPVLTLPWLGAVVTIVATAAAFVLLTRRSAGGPVPWSIAAGLARGVGAWSRGRDELASLRPISSTAEAPAPPIDTRALPLAPLPRPARESEARVDEGGDPNTLAEAEIEDLGTRQI